MSAATASSRPPSKAFLSHSSLDKGFVENVALRLGRVQVVYDKWCFETGDSFVKKIPEAIGGSELFVLFASRASLESIWVQLEADHAELLLASAALKKAVVFIIDETISHSDLPKWMQSRLVRRYSSPYAVAREIQTSLDRLRGVKQKEYFFGRDQLMQEFTGKLYPVGGSLPPNILVLSGLSGMGRRTLARRVLEDRMSLRLGPTFHLRKGDNLDALHLALLLETCPLMSKERMGEEIVAFRAASPDGKAAEIARLLLVASEGNVAPLILDDGALLESDGSYTLEADLLLRELRKNPQLTTVFIQARLPKMSHASMAASGMCSGKVPPLFPDASSQFLQRRFTDNDIEASAEQIENLVPHLGGYPPAFNMATAYAKDYGLPVLLNRKSILTSFQQQEFADFLDQLNLSTIEWGILRLLAAGMEVPIEGLMAATGQSAEKLVPAVQRLVDLSLILNNGGTLAVAGPLIPAIHAAKGTIPAKEYAFLGKSLKSEFWDGKDALPDYGILEATISALLKSDEPDLRDFRHFVVPSMLFRNANYHYRIGGHDQWLEAKKLLDLLIVLEPNNVRALSLLLKIHVRLRKFNDAESILAELKKLKAKERHFLEGFLLWKRRRFSAAVPHFETALQLGQEAVDIYHGLASCLFHLGKLDEAKKVVERGLRGKARDVVLLVDIAAQIAIARGDLEEAETYVEQLRRLKADADYHHRMATLLNARHRSTDALTHARAASEAPRARFENKTTLINTLIEVKNFSEAQRALDRLDEEYKFEEDRSDVRLGLRCKCLLRQEKWSQAEPIWEGLSDIGSPIHAALRKEMLKQKIADKKTTLAERNDANLQLAALVAAPGLESLLFADLVVAEYAAETNDE